jgi:hypothetical protein
LRRRELWTGKEVVDGKEVHSINWILFKKFKNEFCDIENQAEHSRDEMAALFPLLNYLLTSLPLS